MECMLDEMKTIQERMEVKIDADNKKIYGLRNKMWTSQEDMQAMLEANPEETKSIAEHQEVTNKEAAVETILALEDWHGTGV